MRDYSKVAPQFWTGDTGKKIRSLGREAQVIALYLLTCPSSNALGLYYMPLPTLCHETGCPIGGASKALRRVCEAGFASYDEATEHVFVYRMAEYQIGNQLQPSDKRIPWIKKELQAYRNTPFFDVFISMYKDAFHLSDMEGLGRGIEAPSMPVVRAVAVDGARAVDGDGCGAKPLPSPSKEKHLRFVMLTTEEHAKLQERLNGHTDAMIERLDSYIGQIGVRKAAKYVSHYDTILNWWRKDVSDGKATEAETTKKPEKKIPLNVKFNSRGEAYRDGVRCPEYEC